MKYRLKSRFCETSSRARARVHYNICVYARVREGKKGRGFAVEGCVLRREEGQKS